LSRWHVSDLIVALR